MSPQDAMFSENPEEVRARFQTADEAEVVRVAHELANENRTLDRILRKTQLGSWWAGLVQDAKTMVEEGGYYEGMIMDGEDEGDVMMA